MTIVLNKNNLPAAEASAGVASMGLCRSESSHMFLSLRPYYSPAIEALTRLLALITTGDRSCLIHALALALWGQHDRTLVSPESIYSLRA